MGDLSTHDAAAARPGSDTWLVVLAYCVVCSALLLPLALHPYLPMIDLPNHMARRHIAANQAQNAVLSQYYVYSLHFVPNIAVDALHGLFAWRGDPYIIARLSVAAYITNFIFSVLALSRVATGRWRLWPLASALVVYNACLYWGFENYLFSVPFAIHGLTLWLLLAAKPTWLRVLIFTPISLLVFLGHFFAFVAFAMMVAGREFQVLLEASKETRLRVFFRSLALAVPFIPPVIWLVLQSVDAPPVQGNITEFGGIGARIEAALSPTSIWPFARPIAAGAVFEALVVVFLILILAFALRKSPVRLEIAPSLKGSLSAVAVIAILSPAWLNGVAFVQLRYPFIFIAILIAASRWQGLSRRQGTILCLTIAALIVGRVAVFNSATSYYSKTVSDLIVVLRSLPEGARVIPLNGKGEDLAFARNHHYPGYAVIERNALVPTLFQGVHALTVRPEWKEYTHPWLSPLGYNLLLPESRAYMAEEARRPAILGHAYWLNWEDKFTHILGPSQTDVDLPSVLPVVEIANQGAFALFAICPQSCP